MSIRTQIIKDFNFKNYEKCPIFVNLHPVIIFESEYIGIQTLIVKDKMSLYFLQHHLIKLKIDSNNHQIVQFIFLHFKENSIETIL